jgi:uncharacterized coiled-coil protein SlyX
VLLIQLDAFTHGCVQELKRFIAEREREIGMLRDKIAQEKNQTRHHQFERERREKELEERLMELTTTIAFKDKEVLEIQHELEKTRKETTLIAKQHKAGAMAAADAAATSVATTSKDKDGALVVEGETYSDRLHEFLLDDSVDSLTESQPPDEEDLLGDARGKGAATFRSLTKKAHHENNFKPLKLNPARAPPAPSTSYPLQLQLGLCLGSYHLRLLSQIGDG